MLLADRGCGVTPLRAHPWARTWCCSLTMVVTIVVSIVVIVAVVVDVNDVVTIVVIIVVTSIARPVLHREQRKSPPRAAPIHIVAVTVVVIGTERAFVRPP